jgi:hypothetical protein
MVAAAVLLGQVALADAHPGWRWLIVCDGPGEEAERVAIVRALRLLPRLPARVVVRDQHVDEMTALRYLAALDRRPNDQTLASR